MITYGQLTVTQGGADLTLSVADELDYIRCLAGMGNQEIALPDASEVVGRRYTIRKLGTQTVYVNAVSGQTIEGSTATYTLPAEPTTFQAIHFGGTSYGWERV
ncbi:MAG TPA: hypothetical protein VFR37_14045 [Longimicrobium sp.]|nr:hypothetical protein [Longimicrobium sp.]